MTHIKLDDGFFEHPKAIRAGRDGRDMYIVGLCYCGSGLTDGFIPDGALVILGAKCGVTKVKQAAAANVQAGLWEIVEGGFRVHDYLEHQTSSEKVRAERDAARERMQRRRSPEVRPNIERSSPEVRIPETETETVNEHTPSPLPPVVRVDDQPIPMRPMSREDRWAEKLQLFDAYCRGVGIKPGSAEMESKRQLAYVELDPVVGTITAEKLEEMAGWTLRDWQAAAIPKTPKIANVLQNESEYDRWVAAGRPDQARQPKRGSARAPTPRTDPVLDRLKQIAEGEE